MWYEARVRLTVHRAADGKAVAPRMAPYRLPTVLRRRPLRYPRGNAAHVSV